VDGVPVIPAFPVDPPVPPEPFLEAAEEPVPVAPDVFALPVLSPQALRPSAVIKTNATRDEDILLGVCISIFLWGKKLGRSADRKFIKLFALARMRLEPKPA